jgi:large exoprotein involved in heme utilization and adhesion
VISSSGHYGAAGGDITIAARTSLTLTNQAFLSSRSTGSGKPGGISIDAGSVRLSNAALTSESTQGADAADIVIRARDRLVLQAGSTITSESARGGGGRISIVAGKLVQLGDSAITTSVYEGAGNGGDISIDPVFVVLDNSEIRANAETGTGGNIDITSQFFIKSSDSVVDASSRLGISGTVAISAPQVDLGSGLAVLSSGFLDASSLLRASCGARAGNSNSFMAAGRGGLAEAPPASSFARSKVAFVRACGG